MGIQLAPIEGTPYAGGTATGVIYLDANGLQRSNGPAVDASGNVTVSGTFTVEADVGSDPLFSLRDMDVVHGLTGLMSSTNDLLHVKNYSGNKGGAWVIGAGEHGAVTGLSLQGVIGVSGATTAPAILLNGSKQSGSSTQAVAATEEVLRLETGNLSSASSHLLSVLGSGYVGINTATPNAMLDIVAAAITNTPLAVNGSVGQTADLILANDGSNDVFAVAQNGDVDLDRTGDTAGPSVQLSHWSSKTAKRSTVDFRKSGSNTKGGNTTLSDSTQMGDIFWWGNDGNGFHESARIYGLSAGTANNNTPGKIRFATTPSGAYTAADRMEIDESGLVSVYDDLAITSPTVPASASATGTAGTVSWDADYVYICTATDTWKRVAISTW